MENPFLIRAAELLRDDEAFLAVVSPEPVTHHLKKAGEAGILYDRLVLIRGTPGSGKTTMARLFEYPTLYTLLRNKSSTGYKELHAALSECRAVKDEEPLILGCRLPMESDYRDFWEFPYADEIKTNLPQLGQGKRSVLEEVHKFVNPHEVCPILPFPATWPRSPDTLIEGYGDLFEGRWKVDARDLIYAHEKSPLDLYRAILRIDNARQRVFRETGGSQVILSPVGSKAVALGMLMAALERNFAVVLVESLAYKAAPAVLDVGPSPAGELVHIWLHGEAYASATREVSREG